MTRIPWKLNKIVGLQTRPTTFVVGQMLKPPYMLFYHLFRERNHWEDIALRNVKPLFCVAVSRGFISQSTAETLKVEPVEHTSLPTTWISPSAGSRRVTVWSNTEMERSFFIIGSKGASLIKRDIATGRPSESSTIVPRISRTDDEIIDAYELTNVRTFPELNERLYLCHLLGRNVDPLKDLLFDRPIPPEYESYIDILMS